MADNREPLVLYEVPIKRLSLELATGPEFDATHLLANGRANYILFENFVAQCTGLKPNSQGGAADLCDSAGSGYEVKSYRDPQLHPEARYTYFHTAASSTFGPNNHGPTIKKLLNENSYAEALEICKASGYAKSDYYVYLNTAGYNIQVPLRYVVVPVDEVLGMLSKSDPRLISRDDILARVTKTVVL